MGFEDLESTTHSIQMQTFVTHAPVKVSYTSRFPALPPPHTAISGFGKQVNAVKQSFPAHTIPKADIEDLKRTHISDEHAKKTNMCTASPGPQYRIEAPKSTGHLYSYAHSQGRGSSRSHTFSKPGVVYNQPSTFGHQLTSTRVSQPRQRFGSTSRGGRELVWMGEAYQKHIYAKDSPGPHQTGSISSIGRQASSKKVSSSNFKFGSAPRFQRLKCQDTSVSPGPGAYH